MKKILLILVICNIVAFKQVVVGQIIRDAGNTIEYVEGVTVVKAMNKEGLSIKHYGNSDDEIRFIQTNKTIFRHLDMLDEISGMAKK
jgi:hypothetical protein